MPETFECLCTDTIAALAPLHHQVKSAMAPVRLARGGDRERRRKKKEKRTRVCGRPRPGRAKGKQPKPQGLARRLLFGSKGPVAPFIKGRGRPKKKTCSGGREPWLPSGHGATSSGRSHEGRDEMMLRNETPQSEKGRPRDQRTDDHRTRLKLAASSREDQP